MLYYVINFNADGLNPVYLQADELKILIQANLSCIKLLTSLYLVIYSCILVAEDQVAWEIINQDDDILIYTKKLADSPLIAVKAVSTLNADMLKVVNIINDNKKFSGWVPRLLTAYTLEKNSTNEWIEYVLLDAPWPLKNREFVLKKTMTTGSDNDYTKIKFHSVDTTLITPDEENVRAIIYDGSFTITSINDNKSRIDIIAHADLKGFIPDFIKNYLQKVWPLYTLRRLKKQVIK